MDDAVKGIILFLILARNVLVQKKICHWSCW